MEHKEPCKDYDHLPVPYDVAFWRCSICDCELEFYSLEDLAAHRDAALAEAMEALPKKRSHMQDKDYPHDDCLHCTEYNQGIDDSAAALSALREGK